MSMMIFTNSHKVNQKLPGLQSGEILGHTPPTPPSARRVPTECIHRVSAECPPSAHRVPAKSPPSAHSWPSPEYDQCAA